MKLVLRKHRPAEALVAPRRGAWIETGGIIKSTFGFAESPPAGGVD